MNTVAIDEREAQSRIREWVALLAAGQFDAAASALEYPADAKVRYTPELLRSVIGSYRRAYREAPERDRDRFAPRVSYPNTMDLDGERFDFYPNDNEPTAIADYALPLDGEWSDLTATFLFFPASDGTPSMSLYDVRVM